MGKVKIAVKTPGHRPYSQLAVNTGIIASIAMPRPEERDIISNNKA
jgi:hypothetical protein